VDLIATFLFKISKANTVFPQVTFNPKEQECLRFLDDLYKRNFSHTVYDAPTIMRDLGITDRREFELLLEKLEAGIGVVALQGDLADRYASLKIMPQIRLKRDEMERNIASKVQNLVFPQTIPTEITDSLAAFRQVYGSGERLGFVMMKFGSTTAHDAISKTVREAMGGVGLLALRADDREFHSDLFYNILTYIYGCSFGIAVFERIEADDFNPNVSLEVGIMVGLRKHVCLLKDKTLKLLHTDIVGKLYRPFDPLDPSNTIPAQLHGWLKDKGFVK